MASAVASRVETHPLPFDDFRNLSNDELESRIQAVKSRLGDSLLILGHHYQQDEVIRFADLRGDSYKLSQLAAESQTCRAIVFCGVHFMAETADILSRRKSMCTCRTCRPVAAWPTWPISMPLKPPGATWAI